MPALIGLFPPKTQIQSVHKSNVKSTWNSPIYSRICVKLQGCSNNCTACYFSVLETKFLRMSSFFQNTKNLLTEFQKILKFWRCTYVSREELHRCLGRLIFIWILKRIWLWKIRIKFSNLEKETCAKYSMFLT